MGLVLSGCAGSGDSTPNVTAFSPTACAQAGGEVNTNSGGSIGSNYGLGIGSGTIMYSNINNTFYRYSNGVAALLVDVGTTCLSSISAWPGGGSASAISAIVNHAYIVQFNTTVDGVSTLTYAKFIINSYSNGVLRLTYVPNL